jgi:hypothetical protein
LMEALFYCRCRRFDGLGLFYTPAVGDKILEYAFQVCYITVMPFQADKEV